MKKQAINSVLIWVPFLVLTLFGCKQNLGEASWDVEVLAPVLKTELSMADLLADSLLEANADGALRLKVETPLIDLPIDSILKIPDTTIAKNISIPISLTANPGQVLPSLFELTKFNLGDVALKKITLRTGKLRLSIKSALETEVDFVYEIGGAQKFGAPFIVSETMARGTVEQPSVSEFEFDLSGYDIDLRGSEGTSFNTLENIFSIQTSETGDTVSIQGSTPFLFLEYSFFDIVPNYASGYFGEQSTNIMDENSEIDVLNRITEGQMFLDSVSIDVKIINGVGADAKFNLGNLSSINTRTGNTIELNHEIIANDILITRAQDPTGNAADVIASELLYSLNNSNSNIKEFIENLPDQLGFSFGFGLNPLGNVSAGNDFFYYDRPFEAIMSIDIPLRTTLTNLTLVDTLIWNLSENAAVASINSGYFTLIANNGFPLEGQIELILLDESMLELDTLLVPSIIAAPPLDAENKVISWLETRVNIPIPDKTTDILTSTRHIRIKVKFNTSNQPDMVEFYDTYGIDLKLTGRLNINFGPASL
ncbi:MAG: hypothetical protein JKX84_09430 [Flavobacteriales bacterium]|nr:hypothetical protein [Flavobacteriales bacterium]